MATEPIRERILQHVATSLGAINGTGAYWLDLQGIARGQRVPDDLTVLPFAMVSEGEEVFGRDTNLLLTRILPVTVEVWIRSAAGDLPTLSERMLADLERALMVDPTRGGLAIRTDLVAATGLPDEAPGVLASIRATFEIQYWTLVGEPASVG